VLVVWPIGGAEIRDKTRCRGGRGKETTDARAILPCGGVERRAQSRGDTQWKAPASNKRTTTTIRKGKIDMRRGGGRVRHAGHKGEKKRMFTAKICIPEEAQLTRT